MSRLELIARTIQSTLPCTANSVYKIYDIIHKSLGDEADSGPAPGPRLHPKPPTPSLRGGVGFRTPVLQ